MFCSCWIHLEASVLSLSFYLAYGIRHEPRKMFVCVMTGGGSQEDVSTVHIDDYRERNGKSNNDAPKYK